MSTPSDPVADDAEPLESAVELDDVDTSSDDVQESPVDEAPEVDEDEVDEDEAEETPEAEAQADDEADAADVEDDVEEADVEEDEAEAEEDEAEAEEADDENDEADDELEVAVAPTATHVRDLTHWHIPFHYAPAIVVIVSGLAMLLVGGTVGWIGGWWLAAALPIAIGAFLRSAWFAVIPPAVWGGWLIYAGGAEETATLSNTPTLLGVCLGLIGAGSTVLAQRAVFPATEPGAWEASVGRIVPPLDDGAPVDLDEHTDDHTLAFAVVEPIEASDEELEAAAAALQAEATAPEVLVDDVKAEVAAADAAEGTETELVETEDDEDDSEQGQDSEDEAGDDSDEDKDSDDSDEDEDEDSDDAEDDSDEGDADDEPATEAAAELPVDEDPAGLDEGAHPVEFQAITEADLAAYDAEHADEDGTNDEDADADEDADGNADSADIESDSADDTAPEGDVDPADDAAPLPPATPAGNRRRKRSR